MEAVTKKEGLQKMFGIGTGEAEEFPKMSKVDVLKSVFDQICIAENLTNLLIVKSEAVNVEEEEKVLIAEVNEELEDKTSIKDRIEEMLTEVDTELALAVTKDEVKGAFKKIGSVLAIAKVWHRNVT